MQIINNSNKQTTETMMSFIRKVVMYKSVCTSAMFGLFGATHACYTNFEVYEQHLVKPDMTVDTFEQHVVKERLLRNRDENMGDIIKIVLTANMLIQGGTYTLLGTYPVIGVGILSSMYAYNKYVEEEEEEEDKF